jgi:hypothetical protein
MKNKRKIKEFIFHKISKSLNKKNSLFKFIRRILHGFLTIFYFSYFHNHFKSCIRGKSIDKNGNYLPWFTYPIVEILINTKLNNKKILEFGAGCSTSFFLKKKSQIISYEENFDWYEKISKIHKKNKKLTLIHRFICEKDKLKEAKDKKFSLIIIDGHMRQSILKKVTLMSLLEDDGAIIFDNSEVFNFSNIIKAKCFNNFQKIDFYGHTAGVFRKHCTSVLFFKNSSCFLFDKKITLISSYEINSSL